MDKLTQKEWDKLNDLLLVVGMGTMGESRNERVCGMYEALKKAIDILRPEEPRSKEDE